MVIAIMGDFSYHLPVVVCWGAVIKKGYRVVIIKL